MENRALDRVLNVAGYQFGELAADGLKAMRESLRRQGSRCGISGTILLSPEGVNLFLSGEAGGVRGFLQYFREVTGFSSFEVKESWGSELAFNRFLIRIKPEIIAFGVRTIVPWVRTSPCLSAVELKQWLDEGKDFILLDTRNDYEIKVGTFEKAVPAGIGHFKEFPEAVDKLSVHDRAKPVVTFCTGGIRCEKAAPYLESRGFTQVYQLQGGILKYFEECGGAHYRGDCFVFDHRVALSPSLQESEVRQCYGCRAVLLPEDFQSPDYIAGRQCPFCVGRDGSSMEELCLSRNDRIRQETVELPGALPYENQRPLKVPAAADGMEILAFLKSLKFRPPEEPWEDLMELGRLTHLGKALAPGDLVKAGTQIIHHVPMTTEPAVNGNIEILYEDEALIVVNKPAPLPVHASGRYNRNTLEHILRAVYAPIVPRCAHRLDANTCGVMVLTKSKEIASILQPDFEDGKVVKRYVARVVGNPPSDRFSCSESISRESTSAGGRYIDPQGLSAETGFSVIERFQDGTTLLSIQMLHGGRTHQIRLHLWHSGIPVMGDPLYLPGYRMGDMQTLEPDAPPMCLQASILEFIHPTKKHRVRFEAPLPSWMKE